MNTIELRKEPGEGDPLKEWIQFFNAASEEELDMIQTKNPGLLDAIEEIKRMGLGRCARQWYEAGLKERRDRNARDAYVWNEGLEQGLAAGREQGMEAGLEQRLAMQIRAKQKKGKTVEQIAGELEDTEENIRRILEKWKNRKHNNSIQQRQCGLTAGKDRCFLGCRAQIRTVFL